MPEFLQSFDVSIFRFINSTLSNPVFDVLMPFVTDLNKQRIVLALVAAIVLWMLIRGDKRTRLAAIVLICTITFSDQLSSSIVKFMFERVRPCRELLDVRLLVSCGSGFSFPSSHAVNNFAGALVLSFFFPRAIGWLFGFASVVAFSRVYVGVHYPLDVLGGSVIGLICGALMLVLFIQIEHLYLRIWYRKKSSKNSGDNS